MASWKLRCSLSVSSKSLSVNEFLLRNSTEVVRRWRYIYAVLSDERRAHFGARHTSTELTEVAKPELFRRCLLRAALRRGKRVSVTSLLSTNG